MSAYARFTSKHERIPQDLVICNGCERVIFDAAGDGPIPGWSLDQVVKEGKTYRLDACSPECKAVAQKREDHGFGHLAHEETLARHKRIVDAEAKNRHAREVSTVEPPPLPPATPKTWYAAVDGNKTGPMTLDALAKIAKPGLLVWKHGMGAWQPAESVPEVAATFAK